MSNNDHLRLVSSPPALASTTTRRLLPSPTSGKLLVPLPNEWRRQALHVRQLLGGTSQLQSPFANGLCDSDRPGLCFKSFELLVDTGQVIVQFAVARDIRSNAPVIKLVGCFGKVSVNGGGTNEELVEPGGQGVDGFRRVYSLSIDGKGVGGIQWPLLLSICLDVPVMGRSDPVGFSVRSFAQWDLEVRVHGVADISVGGSFVSFGVPFDS